MRAVPDYFLCTTLHTNSLNSTMTVTTLLQGGHYSMRCLHIVPCGKFHRIGGAPLETFSCEKYDAPEEVGGNRKSFDSPIRK